MTVHDYNNPKVTAGNIQLLPCHVGKYYNKEQPENRTLLVAIRLHDIGCQIIHSILLWQRRLDTINTLNVTQG